MANYSLRQHKRGDMVKWIIAFVLIALLIGAVACMGVALNKQITTSKVSSLAYKIGGLDENGAYVKDTSSIVTKDFLSVEDMKIEMEKDALITYKVFFFDKNEEFISADEVANTTDYKGVAPENATLFKVVIRPTKDAEVTWNEIANYAHQLIVSCAK